MSKILSVSNKLLSLRGRIQVTDEADAIVYEGRGEFALLSPTWRVYAGAEGEGQPLATIRKRLLAWAPTWDIQAGNTPFQIRKKIFSWTRQYTAVGGDHDGAVIKGNFWDLDFTITHGDRLMANAVGKLLSLRDRQNVEVFEGELFVVIAMLVLHIDQRAAKRSGD